MIATLATNRNSWKKKEKKKEKYRRSVGAGLLECKA
jgi:hypothetical protein